jgi:hypothetical protein
MSAAPAPDAEDDIVDAQPDADSSPSAVARWGSRTDEVNRMMGSGEVTGGEEKVVC